MKKPRPNRRITKRRTRRHIIKVQGKGPQKVVVSSGRKHHITLEQEWSILAVDVLPGSENGPPPGEGEWEIVEVDVVPGEGDAPPSGVEPPEEEEPWEITEVRVERGPGDDGIPAAPADGEEAGPEDWRIEKAEVVPGEG